MEKYEEILERYFSVYAVAQEFTNATIKTKKFGIADFANFCRRNEITEMTSDVINEYMATMLKRGNSRNYVQKRIYSDVKPFLDYADRRGVKNSINWDDDFKKKKRVIINRRSYSQFEIFRIFKACRRPIDVLMIALAYECGLRRIELTRIYRENFDARHKTIFITRKGDKPQVVSLPDKIAKMIELEFAKNKSRYLFPAGFRTDGDAPVSVDTLQGRIKLIGRRAGIPGLHLHELRYSFATELYDSGADMRSISQKLNHSDIHTTELYIQRHNSQIESDYEKCFNSIDQDIFAKFGGENFVKPKRLSRKMAINA